MIQRHSPVLPVKRRRQALPTGKVLLVHFAEWVLLSAGEQASWEAAGNEACINAHFSPLCTPERREFNTREYDCQMRLHVYPSDTLYTIHRDGGCQTAGQCRARHGDIQEPSHHSTSMYHAASHKYLAVGAQQRQMGRDQTSSRAQIIDAANRPGQTPHIVLGPLGPAERHRGPDYAGSAQRTDKCESGKKQNKGKREETIASNGIEVAVTKIDAEHAEVS